MNCPLCIDEVLDITYHGGIEVDICPRCRGLWLDRGELERLVGDAPPSRRSGDRDDGRDRRPAPEGRDRRQRSPRSKRLSERLGDVFEEVLDL